MPNSKIKKGHNCLNCGCSLENNENYCPDCGQINDIRKISVGVFIHTLLAGFYSFDSRFIRTIVPLLSKPGKVSVEYIAGKRTYYSNPFQLLLQTNILLFLIIGLFASIKHFNDFNQVQLIENNKTEVPDKQKTEANTLSFEEKFKLQLDSLFQNKKNSELFLEKKANPNKDSVFSLIHEFGVRNKYQNYNIKDLKLDIDNIDTFNYYYLKTSKILESYFEKRKFNYKIPAKYYENAQGLISNSIIKEIGFNTISETFDFVKKHENLSTSDAIDSLKLKHNRANHFWYQKVKDFYKITKNEEYRKTYIDSTISKFTIALFLFLPIFTLFFTLIFFTSKYTYSENLIVVFNLQTVFLIVLIISIILSNLSVPAFIISLFYIAYFVYLYKTLRFVYKQNRLLTIIKYMIVNFMYFIFSVIGIGLIFFITFLLN